MSHLVSTVRRLEPVLFLPKAKCPFATLHHRCDGPCEHWDHPLAPPPDPSYPIYDVIAEATDLDGNHVVMRRGYYDAVNQQGFGWDKAYLRHGVINPNVFADLISHRRPISNDGAGTLVYEVPINRTHCTSGFLGLPSCNDTGESLTMRVVVNTAEGRPGIPDGGQKGLISMYPKEGGSGVVLLGPNLDMDATLGEQQCTHQLNTPNRSVGSPLKYCKKLLRHIEVENLNKSNYPQLGNHVYRVSHAWTDGHLMFVVYQSPPLTTAWGLVRDTTESLIDPGPWNDADNPALYYYLLDLEEGWAGPISDQPEDDPEVIFWRGDKPNDLPERLSDIPGSYRQTAPSISAEEIRQEPPPVTEPRRYADPNGPLPPGVRPPPP